jgi:hypothetical protein
MRLWIKWYRAVAYLKTACVKRKTYFWMVIALLGFCVRPDLDGLTSFIRGAFIRQRFYGSLVNLFHSPALCLERLTTLWVKLVLLLFQPLEHQGYLLLVADGLKIPKEGKKMPGVKRLHQSSSDNAKPNFIMGHSLQAVGLLVRCLGLQALSIPLASRIHEGIIWTSLRRLSLLDKLVRLLAPIQETLGKKTILIADAYYASRKIVLPLLDRGHHLVTRVRTTAVGYRPAPVSGIRGKGRPKLYGEKVQLNQQWRQQGQFQSAASPVYREKGVTIDYLVLELLWRPIGRLVKFILVKHPTRGRVILMTTMTSMDPLEVIRLYGYRFKIESSFKSAIHTLGAYAYKFWMKSMTPLRRNSGDQYMHRKSPQYREAVRRKIGAYHRYIQLACVAQGLLLYLAVTCRRLVWRRFGSWMRTMNTENTPSERVVAQALRSTLPQFLLDYHDKHDLEKVSSPGEFHPEALQEPDVRLSPHPAPTVQPPV